MPQDNDLYAEVRSGRGPRDVPGRALTIGAHPDDAEFGAAGTLASWADAGCEITMLVVTDGSKGTWDPHLSPSELVEVRRAEQRAAAAALGVHHTEMLDYVDGELEYSMALRAALCGWIRRLRPDAIFTHDPWQRYQLHPDHRVTGLATLDAVVAARDHLFFPEQLVDGVDKHRPSWVLLWSADQPDHWVDISATFDRKLAALLEHSSQGTTTMGSAHRDEQARAEFEARMRAWSGRLGEPAGIRLAESFKVIEP
jgi:LmbE family N-acetylglucosaminyl deacetylase